MSSLSSVGGSTVASSAISSLTNASSSSSVNSTQNASGINFAGLISGLDTNSLIQGLVAIDQARITNLQINQKHFVDEQAAFKGIEANLIDLQSKSASLGRTFNSVFDSKTATSSNADAVASAASAGAVPGVYSFTVTSLAQAQSDSQGFASANASITQGPFTIQVGTAQAKTITIGAANNTLQGLADAINSANAGVSATIINDGSTGTPYHLFLTATQTGLANGFTVTNGLGADSGSAIKPVISTVQDPLDAAIKLGSGAGSLNIASATNSVSTVIPGVTLNLLAANPNAPVSVTVASDSTGETKAINDFVDSFNTLVKNVQSQQTFDPQTNTAGLLLGNQDASSILNQVTRTISNVVANVNSKASVLSSIGITLNDQGGLSVNQDKLTKAVSGQLSGVSAGDIRRLFVLDGTTSNQGVQFIFAGDKTVATGTSPYQVKITKAATQATLTAQGTDLGASISILDSQNTLNLVVNGKPTGTLTLTANDYTPQSLVQELQSQINANSQLAAAGITVSLNGNHLQFTSQAYGKASTISINGGTALPSLGLLGTETGQGQDVEGSFIVNGVSETATGSGQFLSGATGNAHTSGLEVRVNLTSDQIQAGAGQVDLTVSRGIGSQVNKLLNQLTDPFSGRLTTIDHELQTSVDDLQKSIDQQKTLISDKQQQLASQFAVLESTISSLKQIGSQLTSQLTTITNSSTKN